MVFLLLPSLPATGPSRPRRLTAHLRASRAVRTHPLSIAAGTTLTCLSQPVFRVPTRKLTCSHSTHVLKLTQFGEAIGLETAGCDDGNECEDGDPAGDLAADVEQGGEGRPQRLQAQRRP